MGKSKKKATKNPVDPNLEFAPADVLESMQLIRGMSTAQLRAVMLEGYQSDKQRFGDKKIPRNDRTWKALEKKGLAKWSRDEWGLTEKGRRMDLAIAHSHDVARGRYRADAAFGGFGVSKNPKATKKKATKKKSAKRKASKNPTRGGGWAKGQRWPFDGEFIMSEVTTKLFDINVESESEQTGSPRRFLGNTRRVPAKADLYEFMGRIVFVDPADTSGNLTQLGDGVFLPLDRGWLMPITGKGVLIAGVIYPGGKRKHEFISFKDPRIKKRAWINKFRSARKIRGEIYNKFYAVRISIALEYLLPGETVFSSGDKGELETPVFASEKDALSFISSLKKATVSISADSRSRLRYKWVDRGGQRRGNPKKKAAKKRPAKKKVARKKTPEWQLLINRCRKLWDHYCERPSKSRLKPVLEHLEKMKASTSKKVADERKSCLRIANKEARSLKMK